MGRPTKFTPDARDTFLQGIRLGASVKLAGQAAGWAESTTMEYLARGREARTKTGKLTPLDQSYSEFLADVEKAQGVMVQAALAQIVRAAQDPKHWTAAAWLLERVHPEEYARPIRTEISGPSGGPIPVEVGASELLSQLRALANGDGGQEKRTASLRALPSGNGARRGRPKQNGADGKHEEGTGS